MHLNWMSLFAAIVLLSAAVVGQMLVSNNASRVPISTFVRQTCDGVKKYICDSCFSRRPCLGFQEIPISIPCPTKLFCSSGIASDRCGPIPSDDCLDTTTSSPFTCTSVGVLPDPNNCNVYHVCLATNSNSNVYTCPPGYVFDIATTGCIRQVLTSNCITIRCTVGTPGYVLYGTSRQYYSICDGQNRPSRVYRCPNGALFTYFSSAVAFGECVYSCSGQGNYPNSNNPSSYFQCYLSNGQLVYAEIDCPSNTVFSSSLQYCVPSA